jgi:hypothetical protein
LSKTGAVWNKHESLCDVNLWQKSDYVSSRNGASSVATQIKIRTVKSNKRSGLTDGHLDPSVLQIPNGGALSMALKSAISRA